MTLHGSPNALPGDASKGQTVTDLAPSVFVAFPFREREGWIRHNLPGIFRSWGYRLEMGSHFHGHPISESVATTISSTKLVVCFLMRSNKLAAGGWAASDWVLQELGFAKGKGIPVVAVIERGVQANVGLLGDVQLIELDPAAPYLALLPLRVALERLLASTRPELGVRVHHLARPGKRDSGTQRWDFWTWIDAPTEVLDRIIRVSYVFPRSFTPIIERTSNRAAAFGNYGETDSEFDLRVTLEYMSRPKSKSSQNMNHRLTLWRLGYD